MGKGEKGEHGKGGGGHAQATVSAVEKCIAQGCKSSAHRFGFCNEHFDHFKFGLIKKTGEPVPDYDKKYGQYVAWLESQTARKAA